MNKQTLEVHDLIGLFIFNPVHKRDDKIIFTKEKYPECDFQSIFRHHFGCNEMNMKLSPDSLIITKN